VPVIQEVLIRVPGIHLPVLIPMVIRTVIRVITTRLPAIMVIPATVIIPMVLAVIATESHVIITRLPGITDITTGMLSATLVITGGTRGIINNIQDIKMIMSTHDLGMWVDLAHCRLVPSL